MNADTNPAASPAVDARPAQILSAAREVFLTAGWDGFSVESVADFAECSRPLVYKHFASKEDIMLAMAVESRRRRVALSQLALKFEGRPRERMLAMGEVNRVLASRDLPVELFVASTSIRAKTSQERQDELRQLGHEAVTTGIQVVEQAVRDGDLALPEFLTPNGLFFVLWASRWGAANIVRSDTPLDDWGIASPDFAMDAALGTMLDGFKWRPLSSEWDYAETRNRLYAEVFTEDLLSAILNS
jgi:AcrR family transcriptional regulator